MKTQSNLRKGHSIRIVGVVLAIGACVFFLQLASREPHFSPEVKFADASKSGLQIVPASCPSAPPEIVADGHAYKTVQGDSGRFVNKGTLAYCLTNNTGNTLFIPGKTFNEFERFYNAISRIPGLSQTDYYAQ